VRLAGRKSDAIDKRFFGVVGHFILKILGNYCIVKHNIRKGDFYEAERETDQEDSKASARICP
jgi:hypothetical protein